MAPILFGLDKFVNLLVGWPGYLAPWIDGIGPGTAQQAMYAVGVIEVVAGIAVGVAPRFGAWLVCAWLVCAWLAGIIVNLLTFPGFFDIALRDFGLLVGAVALPGWPSATRPGGAGPRPAWSRCDRFAFLLARPRPRTPVNQWGEGITPVQDLIRSGKPIDRYRLADPAVPLADTTMTPSASAWPHC